ncbi:MAG: type II secretion system protein GspD [Betaproteobacteria bacterium]|nr:MAG: type II secretion system protein GspD [Betaproteobacteria bacterium]
MCLVLKSLCRSGVVGVMSLVAAVAFAQSPNTPVTLNFVDADIDVVAKAVGELTGKTFVIDQRVKGKINIQSAQGVAPNLAYPTFLAALRMSGFAVVEQGNIVRIVPEADAKTLPTPIGNAASGVIATKVLPLTNQSATQIANAVRPLMSAANANALVVYTPGNALIITDYSDNIRRIEALISRLDTPSVAAAEFIMLNHANALDVLPTLNRVFLDNTPQGAATDARDRMTLAADPRSNAIIVRSDDANRLSRVRNLIAELDRPTASPGNIRIVYLKHADATQVAQTLRRVLGADGGNTPASSASSSPLASLLPGAASNNSPVAAGSTLSLGSNGISLGGASASAGSSFGASGNLPQLTQNNQTAFSASGATVYADTATNSLVISAPTGTYNNLRAVIEQLDVRRAQVFVEALIVEVQADKAAEFGIQWQVLDGLARSNTQGFGGTNFGTTGNILAVAADPTAAGRGLNVGLVQGAIQIGKNQYFNLGLLARALQNDTSANILSMPTLLALDNEEARFSGGQNVPFLTGQYASTGNNNSVTPFNTVERRDVGLTLKVKPLITEGGAIRMQLYQEVSNIIESAAVAQGLGSVNKRVLESSVLVDDGQIVVLGGLLQEGYTNSTDKVPVLGDAPFFGNLFRTDSRKRTKTNLMIFLRPTVVRDAARLNALSNDRYRALGLEQQGVGAEPRSVFPPMSNPGMPFGQLPPAQPAQPVSPAK